MLRLWNRLASMENDRLTKRIFLWERAQNNQSNWTSQIKNLMEEINMGNVFRNSAICNIQQAEEKIRFNLETTWKNDLQHVPKLRTYSLLKSNYIVEKYITLDIPKPIRSTMAMFRCGVLPLRLETGRYKGEPVEDRICSMCVLNVVETEKHFLLQCPYYNDQRNSLFVKIGYDANLFYFNDSTFIDIVNNFPRQTANFIHNCYNLRQKYLRKPT